jgi:hypothetical protein
MVNNTTKKIMNTMEVSSEKILNEVSSEKILNEVSSEKILNEAGLEMIKRNKIKKLPPILDVDLEHLELTYNFQLSKNYHNNNDLIKICFYSHCLKDWRTYMNWGDYWVLRQLQFYITELYGDKVKVVPEIVDADVVIYLFGSNYDNIDKNKFNIIWHYSHPEKVSPEEIKKYDYMFCASSKFIDKVKKWNIDKCVLDTEPLYACTDFKYKSKVKYDIDVLFIGNARSNLQYGRKSIYDLNSIAKDEWKVELYGAKWELPRYIYSHKWYKGKYIPYDKLPEMYAGAKVNLIDGHEEMQDAGFVSAKIFDTAAAGGNIVMKYNSGIKELFGDKIKMYHNSKEMWQLIDGEIKKPTLKKDLKELSRIAKKHSYKKVVKRIFGVIERYHNG